MGNWDYGSSLSEWKNVMLNYNKEKVIEIIKKYYDEIKEKVMHNSYFGSMDSILLYCYIREYQPIHILEVGSGLSTNIMFKALEKNDKDVEMNSFAIESMENVSDPPKCVNYKFHKGNFLKTFYDSDIDLRKTDFVFIDGHHKSYFSSFYCFEVLEKLNQGTLIHIHDIQDPNIIEEAYKNHYFELGIMKFPPSISDEHYTLFQYLKKVNEYEVLCNSSNLLERNEFLYDFIPESKASLWRNVRTIYLSNPKPMSIMERISKKKNQFSFRRENKKETPINLDTVASSFYLTKK